MKIKRNNIVSYLASNRYNAIRCYNLKEIRCIIKLLKDSRVSLNRVHSDTTYKECIDEHNKADLSLTPGNNLWFIGTSNLYNIKELNSIKKGKLY